MKYRLIIDKEAEEEIAELSALRPLLTAQGWDSGTALCFMLFSLFHWPCSTTLITVYRETGRKRDALLAAALPTAVGALLCAVVAAVYHLFI